MIRLLYLIVLVIYAGQVFAETNEVVDYTPFLNGHPWPRMPVVAYIETTSNIWVHPTDPKHFPTLQEIAETNADFTTVLLTLPDGTVFRTYNKFVLGPYLSRVYLGDFNGDGKPDFVAIKPGSGCGLAGEYCTGVFAFSDGNDYRFTRVETMSLGPQDLIIDPTTKEFRLIHTSFRSAQTSDDRWHSFWVHRFFKWNGMVFEEDSSLPPIWIQYLYRSNHEPTKLLSTPQKEKAWNDDPESKANIEW